MSALKLGRRPFTPDSRDIRYADVRPKALSVPSFPKPRRSFGWGLDFGYSGWKMLGNGPDDSVFPGFQGAGDCFWAGQDHSLMEAAYNARRPVPEISGRTTIADYSAYSGFDPRTGANDTGTDVREGLRRHQSIGIHDDAGNAHQIGTYILLDHENPQELWEALWLSECVGWGMNFPDYAMAQFANGQMWTWQPGCTFDGGHWIIIPGHPQAGMWAGISWARRQAMTEQFLLGCGEEAWIWIEPERYSTVTGRTYQGWRDADLETYFTLLARSTQQ